MMVSLMDAVLESWDRQSRIVANVAGLMTPDLLDAKSREGEWPIGEHLCHIHGVRLYWLSQVVPEFAEGIPSLYTKTEDNWIASTDLEAISACLAQSAAQLRKAMEQLLADPKPIGPYSHPLFFMQHMLWHEGWHVSSLMQTLRAAGHEPSEDWEEANIWAVWRS